MDIRITKEDDTYVISSGELATFGDDIPHALRMMADCYECRYDLPQGTDIPPHLERIVRLAAAIVKANHLIKTTDYSLEEWEDAEDLKAELIKALTPADLAILEQVKEIDCEKNI